jgi:beta-lactamase superfamily II metal-dependent hydrolase
VLAVSSALAQDCQSPPRGLTVVFVNVGQGDCTILRSPSGETLLIDAGDEGKGTAVVLPALQALGVTRLHGTVSSHYHADHLGGLDDVLNRLPVTTAYDRGLANAPNTSSYQSYAAAAGSKRRELTAGAVIDLGAGVRVTTIAVNGKLIGGGSVDISQSAQYENSASVALRVDYGRFSMWVGGDLTGGGNSTSDVETPAGARCGDVDVYQVNHHGSNTSTNQAFLNSIRPECAVFGVGPNS